MKRRYKRGDLWKLVRGNAVQFADFFLKSLGTSPPDNVVSMGLANLQSLSYLHSGVARYLWAYLIIVNFKLRRILTDQDFLLFGITLRSELEVLFKTIKRYIMEAWRALSALEIMLKHPRDMGLLSIVKHMKYRRKLIGAPRLDYCSISWEQVIA